ncbi:MAG: MerR family transcriptional regulator [Actinomycetota bacterium]
MTRDAEPPLELLAIGRFAAACRLTVTTLRHYDDIDLLRPAWVDPDTSYRYYRRSQVPAAITIGALRSLGLGLAAIRAIVHDPDGAAAALAIEHDRAVRELRERERAVATIRRLSELGELPSYDVGLVRRDPVAVYGVSIVAGAEDVVERTSEGLALLVAGVEAAGRPWSDPVASILETSLDADEVRLQIVIAAAGDAVAIDGLEVGLLPGGTFAAATHVGPYELAGFAHDAVRAWAEASDLRVAGEIQERYLNDPLVTEPSALVTEVALPIRGAAIETAAPGEGW